MPALDPSRYTGFDWDSGNELKSQMKHGVTQAEAEDVFLGSPLVADDPAHSDVEARYQALGESGNGRRLAVTFTVRGTLIRIISARDMSRRERQRYEEGPEKSPAVSHRGR